jgi:hypothetical protein
MSQILEKTVGHSKSFCRLCEEGLQTMLRGVVVEVARVVVQGLGPGPRYGHVMSLVGQRFLLSIGGNDGELTFWASWAFFQESLHFLR